MFSRILVPLDGSLLAEQALPPALALAQKVKGELILLRVMEPEAISDLVEMMQKWLSTDFDTDLDRERVERYLLSVRQVHTLQDMPIRIHVREGDPAHTIVDFAEAEGVDLIVMSTHGRSGFTRWLLGSVTGKVFRAANCPVLAVRSDALPNKILVPLDGSMPAEQALEPTFLMASIFGSEVTILRVQPPVELEDVIVETGILTTRELKTQLEDKLNQEAEAYLRRLVTQEAAGQEVKTAVIAGVVGHGILDYAEDNGIDLIAMTTHGRAGMPQWAYGSITDKVLHGATCSLFIIRSKVGETG